MRDPLDDVLAAMLPQLSGYAFALTGSAAGAQELALAAIAKESGPLSVPWGRTRRRARLMAAVRTLYLEGPRHVARWRVVAPEEEAFGAAGDAEKPAEGSSGEGKERAVSHADGLGRGAPSRVDTSMFEPPDDGAEEAGPPASEPVSAQSTPDPDQSGDEAGAGGAGRIRLRSADAPRVREAISELPPMPRAAVAIRYLEGLSVLEVAKHMNSSAPQVRTWLAEARTLLAEPLGSEGGPEEVTVEVRARRR